MPHLPGFWGLLWRLLRFTGEPAPGPIWRKKVMRDPAAVRRTLLRLAEEPGLARLVPSHGFVIEEEVGGLLRRVAARLQG